MRRILAAAALAAVTGPFTPTVALAGDHGTGATTKTVCRAELKEPTTSITKTAALTGKFRTLLNALIVADLYDKLNADEPDVVFTVFAPTDEAFAKLPAGTLETLFKPENRQKLVTILKYHVILQKKSFNFSVANPGEAYPFPTFEGRSLTIRRDGHG
ncbi:MAG: fasciclin domain-containing protein, partial [Gemmataceae bacterium]